MAAKKNATMMDKDECTNAGVIAFNGGKSDKVCPHKGGGEHGMSQQRIWWLDGYYAAHVVSHVKCVDLEYMLSNRRTVTAT